MLRIYLLFPILLFAITTCFAQDLTRKNKIILNNLNIINLAIFEKNTLVSKVVDNGYHLFEYNIDGNPTKVRTKLKLEVEKEFHYDSLARLKEFNFGKTRYFYEYDGYDVLQTVYLDDTSKIYEKYFYNSEGRLVHLMRQNKNGVLQTIYRYDYHGSNLVRKEYYDPSSGALYNERDFVYNKEGKLLEELDKYYKRDSTLSFRSFFYHSYDYKSKLIETLIYQDRENVEKELVGKTSFEYYDDCLLKQEIRVDFVRKEVIVRSHTYKKESLSSTKTEYFHGIDRMRIKQTTFINYTYDSLNNVLGIIYSDDKQNESGRMSYKYLYLKNRE